MMKINKKIKTIITQTKESKQSKSIKQFKQKLNELIQYVEQQNLRPNTLKILLKTKEKLKDDEYVKTLKNRGKEPIE